MDNETININITTEPTYEFQYIWAIIGSSKQSLLNWNIDNYSIRQIDNGTSFYVNTAKHNGKVEATIDYSSDSFSVKLIDEEGTVKAFKRWIYLGELIDAIDDLLLERTTDDIKNEFDTSSASTAREEVVHDA
ncbi:MAG: hypothetical protein HUJ98_01525 [Bacteroidaceae bacterium]|nr:hypothetical protein [Bacteroidaceae bacterium]